MLLVVIGITYGALLGYVGNWLVFWKMDQNKRLGAEPLKGIGAIFLARYVVDAIALFAFGYIVKDTWAIVGSGISVTVAVKVSLLIVYSRKGGRFD